LTAIPEQDFKNFGSQSASLSFHHDDWFFNNNYTGKGQNVIDTTNAAALKAMLQANPNISFIKRMAKAAFDVVFFYNAAGLGPIGARFWVDAVYSGIMPRDWTAPLLQVARTATIPTTGQEPSEQYWINQT
jgi:hypothetical protein